MLPFYILSAVIFLTFLASGTTMPFLALYAESLGASLVHIAWIVGGFSTVNLVANLLWGRVSDRVGRRKPFVVTAMAVLACTNLLISEAPVWWVILPLRLIEGAAFGAYSVASLAMMGDLLEGHPRRARLIGIYRMSGSLAFSIAIVIAGLVAQQYGFQTTYKVAAGIYLTAFIISLGLFEPRAVAHPSSISDGKTSFAALLRGPMLPLLVVAASFNVPFSAVYSVWPLWVSESLGLGRATFAQLWGLAAFIEVPAMALAGYVTDRFGRRPTFSAGLTLFASVYVLYVLAPTLPGLVTAQVIRGFAFAAFTATALTMAIEVSPPEARGRAAGLFHMAQSLSAITGSYVGGPIAQGFGFQTLFASAATVLLLGTTYVQVAVKRAGEGERTAEGAKTAAPRP